MLQKWWLLSSRAVSEDDIVKQAQNFQSLFIARLFGGKLREAWEALEKFYFRNKLSKRYDAELSPEGTRGLAQLKKYFSGKNILYDLRNRFAFHYDAPAEEITTKIDETDEGSLVVYLAEDVGNSLYSFADLLVNQVMVDAIAPGDLQKGLDRLFEEMLAVSRSFLDFIGGCMMAIADQHLGPSFAKAEVVNILEPTEFDKVSLPYFLADARRKER